MARLVGRSAVFLLLWAPLARLMERFVPQLTCTRKKDAKLVGRCLCEKCCCSSICANGTTDVVMKTKFSWICASELRIVFEFPETAVRSSFGALFCCSCYVGFFRKKKTSSARRSQMNEEMLLPCLVFWCARRAWFHLWRVDAF